MTESTSSKCPPSLGRKPIRYTTRRNRRERTRCISKIWIDGEQVSLYRISDRQVSLRWFVKLSNKAKNAKDVIYQYNVVNLKSRSPIMLSFWNNRGRFVSEKEQPTKAERARQRKAKQ